MTLFREAESLDDTAEAAAASLGDVDAETLVKDYWVTEALRVLAERYRGLFAFKGGTSLTKAVRCVDRFSEDVDILIIDKLPNTSYDALMKAMATDVVRVTGMSEKQSFSKRGVKRDVPLAYWTRLGKLYQPEVILEMGRRGTTVPGVVEYRIEPMLSEALESAMDVSAYDDLAGFPVDVVHPARTLWENVALLHTEVSTGAWRGRGASRFIRHYGDVAALLNTPEVRDTLGNSETRASIDAEVRVTSEKYFDAIPAVPDGGYAYSPAFLPTDEYAAYLSKHFDPTIDRLWAPASRPTLDAVLETIADHAYLLDTGDSPAQM